MIPRNGKNPLLYSCNHEIKFRINEKFRKGVHYVWCSEFFDSRKSSFVNRRIPKSSNPAQIYMDMEGAISPFDKHDDKIKAQRKSLRKLALKWLTNEEISREDYNEIVYLTKRDDWDLWRPLLYVIPRTPALESRIVDVPPSERANSGAEYRITDLHNSEFDVVFFDHRL